MKIMLAFRLRRLSVLAFAGCVGGCAVGPDYVGPPLVGRTAQLGHPFHRESGLANRRLEPSDRWWLALRDPLLTRLIGDALAQSPTIRVAEAKMRQARSAAREQYANLLPRGSIDAAYLHNRLPGNLLGASAASTTPTPDGTNVDLYDTNFDATWEIDIFGARRRAIEGAEAQASAAEAQLADAHVQLAAQVAQAYVTLRDNQRRLALTLRSAELQQEAVDLTAQRLGGGTTSDIDLERLKTQIFQTKATADPLRASIDQALNQIAVLVGKEPGALDPVLRRYHAIPRLPPYIVIGDPAGLLRRRPDIRQAERGIAASNSQIGQAVANYFPRVSLLGNVGTLSTTAAAFGTAGSLLGNVGPVLQWNILDFGRNLAKIRQAEAGTDAAVAQYESTVLSALEDAETSLVRLRYQRSQVARLSEASASAAKAAALTRQRNSAGTISVIDLLDVERQRLQTELSLAQAQGQLVIDYIAIQKSLGLGWAESDAVEIAQQVGPAEVGPQ